MTQQSFTCIVQPGLWHCSRIDICADMPADIEDGFSESGRAERDRSELKRLHPCNELADGVQQVPGTAAVWVKTFGCAHNVSDSEFMLGQLQAQGYRHAHSCCD